MEARRVIRATPERIFAHIGRAEHLPRYAAPLWMTVEAVEKQKVAHVVALAGYLIGLPIESVQRVVLRPPHSIEFRQIRGTLRALSGICSVVPVEDGTEVRYRLEVDVGIPMVTDDAARQFLVQVVERMLDRIKLAAERKAPPRRPGRAEPEAAALNGEEDEQAAPEAAAAVPSPDAEDRAPLRTPAATPVSPAEPAPPQPVAPTARPSPGERAREPVSPPPHGTPSRPRGRRRRRRHRGRSSGGPSTPPAPR